MGDNGRTMADEIELKLALPPSARRGFLRHPLLAQASKLGTRKLVNVYFDTPDLSLQRHAIALRTRKQGRRWLQTVKCAGTSSGGLAVRPEWEQPYDGRFDFSAVSDRAVRELLERHKIRSQLAPVFETVFSRTTWRLAPAAGVSILLMLDQGWVAADGARQPVSEIELELEHGEPLVLFDLALQLAVDLPLRPEILSKAERGHRLRSGAAPRPVKAAASPLRPGQTPSEAFARVAAACLEQLQLNELGASADDPEFIHQMRVALRRLRSALRAFGPTVPPDFNAAVPAIRTLARTLGQARDWDVLAEEIVAPARAAFQDDARLEALGATVERMRRSARAKARRALAARAHARFILSLAATLHAHQPLTEAVTIEAFAARRLDKLLRKARTLARAARDVDSGRLHALRIGAKRLRYAIEFFAPLYRAKDVGPALQALTGLQDTLGALIDLANAGAPLMHCAGDDPALREAVLLIGGWHRPRYEALRAKLPGRIREVLSLKRFWRN